MPTVVSTASNPTEYCNWVVGPGGLPRKERKVVIMGGAGVMRKRGLITPLGVATIVSDEDLEFLESLPSFQKHVARGFVTVHRKNVDGDKAARNMTGRDGASPLMAQDYDASKTPTKLKPAETELPTGPRPKKVAV